MARWRKNESMGRAIRREFGGIANGVAKELLSLATLGLFRPSGASGIREARHIKNGLITLDNCGFAITLELARRPQDPA